MGVGRYKLNADVTIWMGIKGGFITVFDQERGCVRIHLVVK